jgi:hypothetical protein
MKVIRHVFLASGNELLGWEAIRGALALSREVIAEAGLSHDLTILVVAQ